MGYGDSTPSGNYRKKPFTKKQLEKMKEQYKQAQELQSQNISEEQKESTEDINTILQSLDRAFN